MNRTDAAPPRLHVLMRSYGGDNRKNRPDFYSKLVCLATLVRATQAVNPSPELIFVNDGPLPEDRAHLMRSTGEVIRRDAGSNRASYRWTVSLAVNRNWPAQDVVWFAEDDYLYRPDAFSRLMEAAREVRQADYFSMYGADIAYGGEPGYGEPGTATTATVQAGGHAWRRHESTTSSFGVRPEKLRQDARLLRLMPATGGAWDTTSCLIYQGRLPFSGAELKADLLPFGSRPPRTWPRALARGSIRTSVSLRALRRPTRRRVLLGAEPDLIAHMETGGYDSRTDWESLARETRAWLRQASPTHPGDPHSTDQR
jgi:hypothetical protein